jgi:hypothetical protein
VLLLLSFPLSSVRYLDDDGVGEHSSHELLQQYVDDETHP